MSPPIKNVVVAGATGNTGPTIVKTLLAAGFHVTALTRDAEKAKSLLHPDTKVVDVDYLSHESLVSALRGGEAVVVCGAGKEQEQKNLIDAAIATGVHRFLPASFADDLTDPVRRAMGYNKDKVAIDDYLRKYESKISQTTINTGPLLDFLLERGILINMKTHSIILYNSGDKRISTTTIPTASAAVAAVLKMGDASKNRAFFVHDVVITQNELLKMGREISPDAEWSINNVSTADLASKVNEAFKTDPDSKLGGQLQKALVVFSPQYITDFGAADNAELGIPIMDNTQLKDLIKSYA